MTTKKEFVWHYGLILHDKALWLHEIYDDGGKLSWTLEPKVISGEDTQDALWALKTAVKDIKAGAVYKIKGNKLIKL